MDEHATPAITLKLQFGGGGWRVIYCYRFRCSRRIVWLFGAVLLLVPCNLQWIRSFFIYAIHHDSLLPTSMEEVHQQQHHHHSRHKPLLQAYASLSSSSSSYERYQRGAFAIAISGKPYQNCGCNLLQLNEHTRRPRWLAGGRLEQHRQLRMMIKHDGQDEAPTDFPATWNSRLLHSPAYSFIMILLIIILTHGFPSTIKYILDVWVMAEMAV